MQKRVASLPAHSAILYGSVSLDADGVPYEQDRPLDTLHARANAPIFGFFDNLLGRGIVGGPLLPIQNVSRETARVAIRILEGESPAKIQTSPFEAATPAYDWRELKRWSINEKQLPPGSQVRFRVPTFWEQYRWRLIAIQVVVLAEAFIIFLLVRNRGRLRRAQRVLDERLRLEELVASVGAAFVNVAPDGMDEEIERWMQRMIP